MRRILSLLTVALAAACGAAADESTSGGTGGAAPTTTSTTSSSSTSTTSSSSTSTSSASASTSGGSTLGTSGGAPGTSTPLCLSFDSAPVHFFETPGRFALADGDPSRTDWIAPETPWLALDRDGDGRIDDGRELFGSMTRLPDGRSATNGFEALRVLDTNHDGRITPADALWSRLRIWSDTNQDRRSQKAELQTLSSRGIEALELNFTIAPRCDVRGNCEVERAAFWYRAGGTLRRGRIVDVHLPGRSPVPAWALAQPRPTEPLLFVPDFAR